MEVGYQESSRESKRMQAEVGGQERSLSLQGRARGSAVAAAAAGVNLPSNPLLRPGI